MNPFGNVRDDGAAAEPLPDCAAIVDTTLLDMAEAPSAAAPAIFAKVRRLTRLDMDGSAPSG
jgi:hypothetical protein